MFVTCAHPQISKDELFAEVLRDILLYLLRDLSDEVCVCVCVCEYVYVHVCVHACVCVCVGGGGGGGGSRWSI